MTESHLEQAPDTTPTFPYAYQEGVSYRLAYERSSLTGKHEYYQQYIDHSTVLGSGVKVHYRHNGEIILQTDNCIAPRFKSNSKTQGDSSLVWINSEEGLILTHVSKIQTEDLSQNNERYEDQNGNLIYERSMNQYFKEPDSLARFHVFFPDPITSSKSIYGGNFVDNNDLNNATLQNEIFEKSIRTKFENDTFWLENQYIKMVQLGTSIRPANFTKDGKFFYNRSEIGFEESNVYYHITRLRAHMDSLGHSNLGKLQVWSDAHGLGLDNSLYASNTNPPRLLFGTGGVDDAEDVTVVVHEYGHALTDYAAPKSNIGVERGALDEGLCDYLAASYKIEISDYNWYNVFPWDGHNEFNSGRVANSKRQYVKDQILDPHSRGEIISSALMEIYFEIGKNLTDQLIFESFYFLDNGMTLPQYGNVLLTVEEEMYKGLYKQEVCTALKNHNLVTSCYVGVSESTDIIEDFKILNSEAFANNQGALSFKSASDIESIKIFNGQGKELKIYHSVDESIEIPSNSFEAGLYILEVKTVLNTYRPKIVKRF